MSEQAEAKGELLDWDKAVMHPKFPSGFVLVVEGMAPVPMEQVRLVPMPIGTAPDDYRGVEVRGVRKEPVTQVETPWKAELDTDGISGRKGIVLIGATKREYLPPKDEE